MLCYICTSGWARRKKKDVYLVCTTIQSLEPRMNACSFSPSCGLLFLTYRGENVFFCLAIIHIKLLHVRRFVNV
jgi:hypothetical protein